MFDFNFDNTLSIYWHKTRPDAIIPTKRGEDAGFDVYTNEEIILKPFSKHLFSTGIQYYTADNYWLMAFDRGSTGSKGLHTHCGVCDKGYRGEVFICLCNDNPYPVKFSKTEPAGMVKNDDEEYFVYNINKAIAQLIPVRMPHVICSEISDSDWEDIIAFNQSERGATKLGESGK
jgi:dUTP pyrophosphatase